MAARNKRINIISKIHLHKKFLLLFVIFSLSLAALIFFLSPKFEIEAYGYKISIIYIFFILLLLSSFTLIKIFIKGYKHAFIGSIFIVICGIFLLEKLTNPFFFILLAAIFLISDILLSRNK